MNVILEIDLVFAQFIYFYCWIDDLMYIHAYWFFNNIFTLLSFVTGRGLVYIVLIGV